MHITLTDEEIKRAILTYVFVTTGMNLQTEEVDVHFIKDGNSTRVDEIKIKKK